MRPATIDDVIQLIRERVEMLPKPPDVSASHTDNYRTGAFNEAKYLLEEITQLKEHGVE